MKRYLGSGLVKGIGPIMAGRIVDAFGEATFDVIDVQVGRLTEVPAIGPVRAERIAATWDEQRHVREVMAALQGHGVSTSLAVRIYKRFGDDAASGYEEGNDMVYGGAGDVRLTGGPLEDTCDGGAGIDMAEAYDRCETQLGIP